MWSLINIRLGVMWWISLINITRPVQCRQSCRILNFNWDPNILRTFFRDISDQFLLLIHQRLRTLIFERISQKIILSWYFWCPDSPHWLICPTWALHKRYLQFIMRHNQDNNQYVLKFIPWNRGTPATNMALNNAQPTLPRHCNMGQSGQSDKTEIKLTDNTKSLP